MESYELLVKPSAVKEIERLPTKKVRAKIVGRSRDLATDPRPVGSEKLTGQEKYRIRQGAYRIVYAVDDPARTVLIVKVGHRSDVHR